MKNQSLKHLIVLSLALSFVFFLSAAVSAQEMMKISGKITAAYTDENIIEVGDVEGHTIAFIASEGTNASTGESAFLDGGKVMNYSMGDLVKGNGPQHGYVKLMMGEDGAICKWEHKVVTTMSGEGKPMISFEGKFTYTGGMGKYAGIKGGGTYKGSFVAEKEYVVDWQGEYALGE